MSERAAAPLASFDLLAGVPEDELAVLAKTMRRREIRRGQVLWRQGDESRELGFVLEGRIAISLQLPGDATVEVSSVGPGEVMGELGVTDGGPRAVTATAAEPTTVLTLGRADFSALVSRRHPTAFALKRRIARIGCARLRGQLTKVADSLGGGAAPDVAADAELEFRGPPDSRYVRRLATFHAFDPLALWGFLTAGRYALCPPGRTLVAEGATSPACYLTINGAVEKVIVRGGRRIRVGLAGPGLAFGYESMIDGGPSPVTAITRERTLVLALPSAAFERLFNGEQPESHVFLDVIQRDITGSLRQALRPHARLAVSL
ncbi:MAG TPA: cyclic nucleotide-binding domain-containing protein [Solirubrobacteraceae bacterium]|nr:cyclic nucleotide-binding domain-containing protein [Solirubrobacteraceae bacterium]